MGQSMLGEELRSNLHILGEATCGLQKADLVSMPSQYPGFLDCQGLQGGKATVATTRINMADMERRLGLHQYQRLV